jgi:hypothetical protein
MRKLLMLGTIFFGILNTTTYSITLKTKCKTDDKNGISKSINLNKLSNENHFTHKHGDYAIDIFAKKEGMVCTFEVTIKQHNIIIEKESFTCFIDEKTKFSRGTSLNYPLGNNNYSFLLVLKPLEHKDA